jgi:hypothetical protein
MGNGVPFPFVMGIVMFASKNEIKCGMVIFITYHTL